MTIQMKKLTVTIMTKASEPLHIDHFTLAGLEDAIESAVHSHIDLRYFPESRHIEERHQLVGVSVEEA